MAKALVTGGCGFIGSHLVESLLENGHSVSVLDNLSSGRTANIQRLLPEIRFHEDDIRDFDALCRAMRGVDYVFHEAAVSSVARSVVDPVETHEVNVHGTLNVLLAAKEAKVRRVIFASSSAVYGFAPAPIAVENLVPVPASPYAASKLAGEGYMQAFYQTFGLETLCLRYFNVYGPRQDPNADYAAVIPSFILRFLYGDSLTIHGDGRQSRDFCYVKDVARANLLAMKAGNACGQPINIGSGQAVTISDLALEMGSILAQPVRAVHAHARPGDVRFSLAGISRAFDELSYSPGVSLEQGLRETMEWYEARFADSNSPITVT